MQGTPPGYHRPMPAIIIWFPSQQSVANQLLMLQWSLEVNVLANLMGQTLDGQRMCCLLQVPAVAAPAVRSIPFAANFGLRTFAFRGYHRLANSQQQQLANRPACAVLCSSPTSGCLYCAVLRLAGCTYSGMWLQMSRRFSQALVSRLW